MKAALCMAIALVSYCHLLAQVSTFETPKAASLGVYGNTTTPANPHATQAPAFGSFAPSVEENNRRIMQEVKEHQRQQALKKQRHQQTVNEAEEMFSRTVIDYELETPYAPEKEAFMHVFKAYQSMLEGRQRIELDKAVYLNEYAFNPSLSWEAFSSKLVDMAAHVGYFMEQEKLSPGDNLAKNLALFKFFTDTLSAKHRGMESLVVSYPMLYDFEDFFGRNDPEKLFVSKLMQTGAGQCRSLPLLYLLLAEKIGAEANLALSPSHSYIKFQDNTGNWHNIELTNHMFTSDQFIMYSGYIKAEALQNEIYMAPQTKEQLIAELVNDLGTVYSKKYGYDRFVLGCANLAYTYNKKSIRVHQLYHNYFQVLHQKVYLNIINTG